MAVSGQWSQRAAHDYTGATKWGNGVNPIHGVRDLGRGREIGTRENLLPLGEPSDVVSEGLTGRDIDFVVEDYVDDVLPGEHFRYQEERPRWDHTTPSFRDSTTNPAMGEWASWGAYNDDDPSDIWPRPGPTGGMSSALDVDHGETSEQQVAIAVPTQFVSGGWLNKERGAVARSESQDVTSNPTAQWSINTGAVQGQGLKSLSNDRAMARGTDSPRSPIQSRTAGMAQKAYGRSFDMGGGPGTPDMFPYQQTPGLKRPFFTRVAGMPPMEDHSYNTMEGRVPYQRVTSPDPNQGQFEVGADTDIGEGWGY